MGFGLPTMQARCLIVPMRDVPASLLARQFSVPAHLLGPLLRHSNSFLERR